MIVLGIESSCDETSAAILKDGKVLCSAIYSQEEHSAFGGVVPEVASRAHLEKVDQLTRHVLEKTAVSPTDLDLIAVTDSPGLAGALLVGISFALGLHTAYGIPVTGINHLEGHISSLFIEHPNLSPPLLVLLASGGHSAIYKFTSFGEYCCLGQTVDDAAGEAFDKVGKLLGFPYPAGRSIEQEASKAADCSGIHFPIARFSKPQGLDFSFSGLKTAVKNFINKNGADDISEKRPQICRAFQKAVVDSLVNNLETASKHTGIKTVAVAGGVACNGALRKELKKRFGENNVMFPSPSLCTDNGAMIAMAGFKRARISQTRFPHMHPGRGI
ncbi:MAG: tRNA (adenosine(37)-N6)-threonylcarbamoyltransferase complex transferase subunit TsaD [Chitinispirillaceae bacterium]